MPYNTRYYVHSHLPSRTFTPRLRCSCWHTILQLQRVQWSATERTELPKPCQTPPLTHMPPLGPLRLALRSLHHPMRAQATPSARATQAPVGLQAHRACAALAALCAARTLPRKYTSFCQSICQHCCRLRAVTESDGRRRDRRRFLHVGRTSSARGEGAVQWAELCGPGCMGEVARTASTAAQLTFASTAVVGATL